MTQAASQVPAAQSLVERKQQRARQRIVEAAEELFAARGFDAVSVSDIAAQAEVGRTTFFRYFGDKTEVVFAKEQALLKAVTLAGETHSARATHTLRDALEQLRPIVVAVCAQAVEDPVAYLRHVQLLGQHAELQARSAVKDQQIATRLAGMLRQSGTDAGVAVLAAQLALACYQAARSQMATPADLPDKTSTAFEALLALTCQ